jgi:hypothetical protein
MEKKQNTQDWRQCPPWIEKLRDMLAQVYDNAETKGQFEMMQTYISENLALRAAYERLAGEWNRIVPEYNSTIGLRRPTGRPIKASPSQQAEILKLRASGMSLRPIARATKTSLNTVCSVIKRGPPAVPHRLEPAPEIAAIIREWVGAETEAGAKSGARGARTRASESARARRGGSLKQPRAARRL